MNRNISVPVFATFLALIALSASSLSAQTNVPLTYDESGNATMAGDTLAPGFLSQDPISGLTTLTYANQLNGNPGDILLIEPGDTHASDLIRFEPNAMYFFSTADPANNLADSGLPTPQTNAITINETGPEGSNGAFYTPGPTDPGGNPALFANNFILTYNFQSEVPEPTTLSFISIITAGLLTRRRATNH